MSKKPVKVPHHFALPYCPCSKGAVKRIGKELLQTFYSVLLKCQVRPGKWLNILLLAQSALSNSSSSKLDDICLFIALLFTALLVLESSTSIYIFRKSDTAKPILVSCQRSNEQTCTQPDFPEVENHQALLIWAKNSASVKIGVELPQNGVIQSLYVQTFDEKLQGL